MTDLLAVVQSDAFKSLPPHDQRIACVEAMELGDVVKTECLHDLERCTADLWRGIARTRNIGVSTKHDDYGILTITRKR